jgi:uncharacterized phiE125 gp8 family phage protein
MVVTRAEVKSHTRITSNDDDAMIDRCIRTATRLCEKMISGHRQFLTAQYSVPAREWWCDQQLKMPRPPLQSVDAVFYFDEDGVIRTLESNQYVVETSIGQPGTIEGIPDISWPSLESNRHYPIEIRFSCGYGAAADVPDEIKTAVLTVCTQLYCVRCTIDQDVMDAIARYLENAVGYGSYS